MRWLPYVKNFNTGNRAMNLQEIRNVVRKESGRYDLSDSELNNFINKAQRWLDRRTEHFKEVAREITTISAGDYFVRFTECRVISSVLIGSLDGLTELERKDLKELKLFYKQMYSKIQQGRPTTYAPAYLRAHNIEDGYIGYLDVMSDWRTYNGIILMPPADGNYHVEVWGKFFTKPLQNDGDESFWSAEEPLILVKATLREIEVFHRNTQGVNDWTNDLIQDLYLMECDFLDDDVGRFDQLEG